MASDAATELPTGAATTEPARPLRVWPAVVLVGLFWIVYFSIGLAEISMFVGFLIRTTALTLVVLVFIVWWFTNRGISRTDRFLVFGAAVAAGAITTFLSHNTVVKATVFFMAIPWLLTAWTLWLLVARRMSVRIRRLGLFGTIFLTWIPFTLIRMEGLAGDGNPQIRWRWSRSGEDLFLAGQAQKIGNSSDLRTPVASREALTLQPGDWPEFRGPNRDGEVHGVSIATDWHTAPLKLVWRQRVGPGWSSVVIVGNRLFTQEQRGEFEAVVCLDCATGRELWVHQDAARFSENLGGVGPRATPTFAEGRIYALGATGILNCLDAATGELKWSHDISADSGASGAKIPMWGFSSSPLIVNGTVMVFAGGESQQNLLAYRAESGELSWTAPAGHDSYSSPQSASIGGEDQILFFSELGLTAVDRASGAVLWEHTVAAPGEPRAVQPHSIGEGYVLVSGANSGTTLIDITRDGSEWHAAERWVSKDLKPFFNDYAIHEGFIYGFDGKIFCCVDAQTGKRRWKQGRYGNGQVLLLADQPVLLVIPESGEAVLVAANPKQHEELGRFQAVNGKTWNHPVIANGRLYVRNAEEAACYELRLANAR